MSRPPSTLARFSYLVLGLVAFTGIVTSFLLSWAGGDGFLGVVVGLFRTPLEQLQFFTFLSNVLVALTSFQLAMSWDWDRTWHVLRIAGIACISITGVVFNVLLVEGPMHGLMAVNNFFVHIATPILAPLLWLLFGPRATTWRRVLLAAIIPIAWLVVTLVRGAITGFYPYFILDVGAIGVGGVVVYVGAILVFYFLLATIMWAVDRWLTRPRGIRRDGPLQVTRDVERAAWLQSDELGPTIQHAVPGFESYALVEHPEVEGEIAAELLARLARHAVAHSGDTDVTLALWAGRGELAGGGASQQLIGFPGSTNRLRGWVEGRTLQARHRRARERSIDPRVELAIRDGALIGLPGEGQGREHLLLTGPLSALTDPGWVEEAGLGHRDEWPGSGVMPNYVWPDDRSWALHCDIDGRATVVAGPAPLIALVLADDTLDARAAAPGDRMV